MPDTHDLRFHRSIYGTDAVRRAAERFAHLGDISVAETETDVLVTVVPTRPELKARLLDELANHALFETTKERRVAC
jgi:hypothetical protein